MKINSGNIKFKSPFILASGPPARTGEMISRAFRMGWAGAVTKTVCLNYDKMINTSPRLVKIKNGIQNIELISNRSPELWAEEIKDLKSQYPDNIVIASISAEANNFKGWQKLTLMMQKAGADVLELNLSCPHGLPEMGMGTICSETPGFAQEIIKEVKKNAQIPVWAKLSPDVTNMQNLAQFCKKSGADGITAINTVKGFAGINIETGKPKLNIGDYSTYGGMSGEIVKPVALKAVSEIANMVKCPVSAVGGIKSWQDAVEFILLGATTVQICSEVMVNGYEIIYELEKGLHKYLETHKINNLEEIRGASLKYIKSFSQLNNNFIKIPSIENSKCIKCGKCYKACNDSGYQAINFINGSFPEIKPEKCSGCGLCSIVCPAVCISMHIEDNKISNILS